ncbi:CWC15-like protein [Chytriomyces cf. hyalinus JEL632]|nr:CWC15-like protein [Chytriomyces cf. hyalinus JEL632]
MTTAARPTWLPAVGGGSLRDTGGAPMLQKSSKDLNAHTKVKLRQSGQNAPTDLLDRNALKQKLLAAERAAAVAAKGAIVVDEAELEEKRRELLTANLDEDDDVDDDENGMLVVKLHVLEENCD